MGCSSATFVHEEPAFVDLQMPEEIVPITTRSGLFCSTTWHRTTPIPIEPVAILAAESHAKGPIGVQTFALRVASLRFNSATYASTSFVNGATRSTFPFASANALRFAIHLVASLHSVLSDDEIAVESSRSALITSNTLRCSAFTILYHRDER